MDFKKIFREWNWTGFGLLAIILIGFFVRFYNLTKLPIFVDEAIYVRWAQVMANEPTLRFLPLSDGKQPMFMWVLMFLIKYFSDPLFIGRLVSIVTGLGTIVGIFTLSYLLLKNKKVSLISTFLYSVSPFAVFFDRMALVDSMLSMFGIWTAIFGVLTARYKRLDLALITGFFLGFAVLTKSPAIFFAILLPSFWVLIPWSKKKNEIVTQFFKLSALLTVTYVLAFGMYNIQRLGPNFELLNSRTGDYVLPVSHIWTNFFDPLIPYLKDFGVWIIKMGPFMLIPLFFLGIYFGLKKYIKEAFILLLWSIFPLFIQSELARVFTARYMFFIFPYLFIIVAMAFLTESRILKRFIAFILVIFIFQAMQFNYYLWNNPEKANLPRGERSGYLEEWTAGQGIKEVADYLKDEEAKNPGKQIVVGTEGYFGTLPDGLQIYLNDLDNVIVIGVGVIIVDTPKSLKESIEAGNKTYLVINKSRFRADAEEQGFTLIRKFPKALRLTDSDQYGIYGPQEELYLFELKK
ncbi:MAG TPA: glycosyltransferase family 39 protein [Patescibacteria group bacterium]|nr:glycosyltransferase family 39 protein [Patescibacteria group bacterium]